MVAIVERVNKIKATKLCIQLFQRISLAKGFVERMISFPLIIIAIK
jgi:hypothetical protein